MKAKGRTVILCVKTMSNKMRESFHVVVSTDRLQEAKAAYESMGYKVVI